MVVVRVGRPRRRIRRHLKLPGGIRGHDRKVAKGHPVTTESPRWIKSSYSNNGGNCVEIAANLLPSRGMVPVRDSKDPHGPA
ncbi:DUF397 domain-containing protein, partial [Streptomyces sp. NPDC101150]|uniref:DUF397 domain-containing protein n=1 Tax=Streptomyces sp. NPDC101150 TaxID=3366114 RepID=UPI00381A19CF